MSISSIFFLFSFKTTTILKYKSPSITIETKDNPKITTHHTNTFIAPNETKSQMENRQNSNQIINVI